MMLTVRVGNPGWRIAVIVDGAPTIAIILKMLELPAILMVRPKRYDILEPPFVDTCLFSLCKR